ncbi:MAG TPA: HAMP domain-containing sensor histidine kinase [Polyangiaceae bacterium]
MPEPPSSPVSAERIQFGWLVRFRWFSIAGQALVITLSTEALDVRLPLAALGAVIGVEVLMNIALWAWQRRAASVRSVHVAAAIAADLLLFTALLYLSGGPSNPFSFLYLVHLALAAVMLPPRLGWALVGLSLACSAALFVQHVPLAGSAHQHHHHVPGMKMDHAASGFDWHLRGMWVALGVAASFIVYFLRRVALELAARERQLAVARERISRSERLASLATLAAGAAHELGSPLGTIAVAARELERSLAQREGESVLQEDARLIRAQVDRCRHILDELASNAGGPPGAAADEVPLAEFIARAVERFPDKSRIAIALPAPAPRLCVPRLAVEKALGSLVHNALLATPNGGVRLSATRSGSELVLLVEDDGPGMPADVLEHATEPFFSTREAGAGMGLGLFLATSVAEQLGGRLELESRVGKGTRASLVLPASALRDDLPHSRAADAA